MRYNKFLYLWPPRPTTTIKPGSPHFHQMKTRKTWRGQLKMNGQRNEVYVSPEREVFFWNRHAGHHRNWRPPQWLVDQILAVVPETEGWTVIDGELLHAKDKNIKNTMYWWDILVYDGEYLLGTEYGFRHKLLLDSVSHKSSSDGVLTVTDNIWLADLFGPDQYDAMWDRTAISYIEGFVFKNTKGKLRPCLGEKNNGDWMVRCRKSHKGYAF